jgi:hypothetical protein
MVNVFKAYRAFSQQAKGLVVTLIAPAANLADIDEKRPVYQDVPKGWGSSKSRMSRNTQIQ